MNLAMIVSAILFLFLSFLLFSFIIASMKQERRQSSTGPKTEEDYFLWMHFPKVS